MLFRKFGMYLEKPVMAAYLDVMFRVFFGCCFLSPV